MIPRLFVGDGARSTALKHAEGLLGGPAGGHPDARILIPERGELGIDRIRETILWARYGPVRASCKVAVIGPAERLSHEGANAMLKLLEDTPPHLAIFLFAGALDRVLPTVRSRSVLVRVAFPSEAASRALREAGYTEEEIGFISWLLGDRVEEIEAFRGAKREPLADWVQGEQEARGLPLAELATRLVAYVSDPVRRRALGWALARALLRAGADEIVAAAERLAQGGTEAVAGFLAELTRFLVEEAPAAWPELPQEVRLAWAYKASLARGEIEDNANLKLLTEVVALWPRRG